MSELVKCSACGCDTEAEKVCCPECGEILPFVDECVSCVIDFSADELTAMFGGD